MAQIGSPVDARHDHVNGMLDDAQKGQRHGVRGGAVRGQSRRAVRQRDVVHAQGLVHGLYVAGGGPVVVGRQDGDAPDVGEHVLESQQARRRDAVVVGDEDVWPL